MFPLLSFSFHMSHCHLLDFSSVIPLSSTSLLLLVGLCGSIWVSLGLCGSLAPISEIIINYILPRVPEAEKEKKLKF